MEFYFQSTNNQTTEIKFLELNLYSYEIWSLLRESLNYKCLKIEVLWKIFEIERDIMVYLGLRNQGVPYLCSSSNVARVVSYEPYVEPFWGMFLKEDGRSARTLVENIYIDFTEIFHINLR
jgi:hypothetical protein